MIVYWYLITLVYSTYRTIRGFLRIGSSLKYIKELKEKTDKESNKSLYKHFILIPVLREQDIIAKTFKEFSNIKGDYQLVFITTQKEDYENKSLDTNQTTRDILKRLIKLNNSQNVISLHYPYNHGVMSHQLNYAVKQIEKNYSSDNIMISVYNADSVVDKDLLINLNRCINYFKGARVIQQSSLFLENYSNFDHSLNGLLLKGVALLQSKWTLSHEIPRIRAQISSRLGDKLESSHLVGHGLHIELNVLKDVGYFPTEFTNEDLPLGFIIRSKGYKIYPLPVLENSESPRTLRASIQQYRTWIYGPLFYPLYLKEVLNRNGYKTVLPVLWAIKYFTRGIMWVLSSLVWWLLIFTPIFLNMPIFTLITIILLITHSYLSFWVMIKIINKNSIYFMNKKIDQLELPHTLLLIGCITYLIHSLGPILGSLDILKKLLFGKEINKKKTER